VLRSSRAVRPFALAVLAALVCVAGGAVTLATQPFMVDLEIPLRAAERWAAGGQPYLAPAFGAGVRAYDLPFLYPPPVLPLLAPFAALPRIVVIVPWIAATVGAAVWLCRRLGIPWVAVPIALAWVPFSEGLVGGNAQVLFVAAFAAVFFGPPGGPWQPRQRDPAAAASSRRAAGDGLATAVLPALKLNQPHAWVALLRRRPAGAVVGLLGMAGIALFTLPLTGIELWRDWLEQVARAADPGWVLRGSALVSLFPVPVSVGLAVISVIAVAALPTSRLVAGTGLLLVVGVPSLRNYGALFVLPALFEVRRELALVAVICIGLGAAPLVWTGILLLAAGWVWGRTNPAPAGRALSPR
jgi:hypothetical protein